MLLEPIYLFIALVNDIPTLGRTQIQTINVEFKRKKYRRNIIMMIVGKSHENKVKLKLKEEVVF